MQVGKYNLWALTLGFVQPAPAISKSICPDGEARPAKPCLAEHRMGVVDRPIGLDQAKTRYRIHRHLLFYMQVPFGGVC